MDDHNDKLSETRGSIEVVPSAGWRLLRCLFPCLRVSLQQQTKEEDFSKVTQDTKSVAHRANRNLIVQLLDQQAEMRNSRRMHRKTSHQQRDFDSSRRANLLDKRTADSGKQFRETINFDFSFKTKNSEEDAEYQVCSLPESELILVGMAKRGLLAKVSAVRLEPSPTSLKRSVLSREQKNLRKDSDEKYAEFQFSRYWNQRYFLFDKFDEGIKVDESSWAQTPPEAVADYIALKCAGAGIILQAFGGIGAITVKLANVTSCARVICCQPNSKRAQFLYNNAKVYEVDNIKLFKKEFQQYDEKCKVDVVVVQPRVKHSDLQDLVRVSIGDFDPPLDRVIMKSLNLSPNLLMLLPAQINLQALCSCLNECSMNTRRGIYSCSTKIDKIYFRNQLRFVLISFGPLVQTDIKLNEELASIYRSLRSNQEINFQHKKVVRYIRQEHGMVALLNLVREAKRSCAKGDTENIHQFYQLIREEHMIPAEKLDKLISEQIADGQRKKRPETKDRNKAQTMQNVPVMEEQKVDELHHASQNERTLSYYSHNSYHSEDDPSLPKNSESNTGSTVVIARMNGNQYSSPSKTEVCDSPLRQIRSVRMLHTQTEERPQRPVINRKTSGIDGNNQ